VTSASTAPSHCQAFIFGATACPNAATPVGKCAKVLPRSGPESTPTRPIEPSRGALTDPHPDVRKAAVLTLTTWPHPARETLRLALNDSDADVRAYARRAIE
jgi:hypothetical protein